MSVGGDFVDIKVGDVNGDGLVDVLANDYIKDAIVVFVRSGNKYVETQTIAPNAGDLSFAIADVDADDNLDIVVGAKKSAKILVLRGGTPMTYVTGSAEHGSDIFDVIAADMNEDGLDDVVFARPTVNMVGVALTENGHLGAAVTATGLTYPTTVAAADVNVDGHLDLISVNNNGIVAVGLGTGLGTSGPLNIQPSTVGGMFAVGDVSGDGVPDLVFLDAAKKSVGVMVGDGKGGFGEGIDVDMTGPFASVALADINMDGLVDVVASSISGVIALYNKGGMAFERKPVAGTSGIVHLVVSDMNDDGRPDLIMSSGGMISVRINEIF